MKHIISTWPCFNPYLLLLILVAPQWGFADFLVGHHQLAATPPDWESNEGELQFERDEEGFGTLIGMPMPVVVGGLGSIGLHPREIHGAPVKREGDAKSPAGIFSLGTTFALTSSSEMSYLNTDYLCIDIDADTETVDDALSRHDHHIVSRKEMSADWPTSEKRQNEPQVDHLVDLRTVNAAIILDIRYATNNNFLGFAVYPKAACYLDKEVAEALNQVQQELSHMQLGLKVFDGYRPRSVQSLMWDIVQDECYVSNPAKNQGRHTRGTAVDLTLVDCRGNELEMPTEFDDFTEKAHSDYPHVSEAAFKNRALLKGIMEKYHFQELSTEWWHFDFEGWHDDSRFPSLNVSFDDL